MEWKFGSPAYRIVCDQLVLRCWEPRYGAALRELVIQSRDTLLPWLAWALEPCASDREESQLLRQFRGRFDLDKDYPYGIFAPDGETVVGGCGLHTGHGEGALMIGYWVGTAFQNRGLATTLCSALLRTAFWTSDIDRVLIQAMTDNKKSCRVIEKTGFAFQGVLVDEAKDAYGVRRDLGHWQMSRQEFLDSHHARFPLRLYGADGGRFPLEED